MSSPSVQNNRKNVGLSGTGMLTHLRCPAGPCSYDKSTAIPNRVRDRSACCRFVLFDVSRGGCGRVSVERRRTNDTGVNNGIYDTRDARGWKDKKRERRGGREKFRHAGSVVLTGAVAGGRLARTLRRDVRRRSISDYLPLSSPSRFPPPSHPPRPGTNGLPDDKPPFQPVTPTCDRH